MLLLSACPKAEPPKPATDAPPPAEPTPSEPTAECPELRGAPMPPQEGASPSLEVSASWSGRLGRPAVLLLASGAGPGAEADFPPSFVDGLLGRGLNVVLVRGLGEGEVGLRDLNIIRGAALAAQCAPDPARMAIVASPETGAAALELAANVTGSDRLSALVLLSGSEATESRVKVEARRAELETLPMLFVYSDRDAAWSTRFQDEPTSPLWLFRRQSGEAHGLALLSGPVDTADDVAVFLEGFLQ